VHWLGNKVFNSGIVELKVLVLYLNRNIGKKLEITSVGIVAKMQTGDYRNTSHIIYFLRNFPENGQITEICNRRLP